MTIIKCDIDAGAVSRAVEEERRWVAKRVRLATDRAGRELLVDPLREMTRSAFKSKKLPTTWRGELYPKGDEETLSPAFYAYSKAPKIIQAFEEGTEIQVRNRKFLAIPAPDAGVRHTTVKNKSLTPAIWEVETGAKLRFVPLKSGNAMLVADGRYRRFHTSTRSRKKWKPERYPTLPGDKSVKIIFFLVKRVRLRKRLDIRRIAERAGAQYAARYERAANAS